MTINPPALLAIQKRATSRAIELLLGIVTGLVADQQLPDSEIVFLKNWLLDNPDAAQAWPGYVIADAVADALADGIISDDARSNLLKVLQDLAVTDFANTGSAASEVLQLPIDDNVDVDLRDHHVCHTGEFLYGTRTKCEELTQRAGGCAVGNITRKVRYLVIGTNVSGAWVHTSYGRKIEAAVKLQRSGHGIDIISERRWLEVIQRP